MGKNKPVAGSARPGRRAVLLGGGAALFGGIVAAGELARSLRDDPAPEDPPEAGRPDFHGAQWVAASPANYRRADRPADFRIDMVVVHVTQGSYGSTLRVFRDPAHAAAAHYVVRKDGRVTQMIRELDVAFHAGNRAYNNRSVGIEHEGFVDRPQDFTDAMYRASARLTADICRRHGIPVDRKHIIGHAEVPGADHTDPGPHWDWPRYMKLVAEARRTAGSARV